MIGTGPAGWLLSLWTRAERGQAQITRPHLAKAHTYAQAAAHEGPWIDAEARGRALAALEALQLELATLQAAGHDDTFGEAVALGSLAETLAAVIARIGRVAECLPHHVSCEGA
jgi:hypothetical protein